MGGGVRSFAPVVGLAMAAAGMVLPSSAAAQGSLQDLVGTYTLTERDVEGSNCANVPMDVQQVPSLQVTAIDDDSVAIAMGGPSSEVAFDSSERTFRYNVEQSGYHMSITGQFVRGRDSVAMAIVYNWQPQIDCFASLTGSKPAPDLGPGEAATPGAFGVTNERPDGRSGWGWLDDPIVLAVIALLMALTAAGVAFSLPRVEKRADPLTEADLVQIKDEAERNPTKPDFTEEDQEFLGEFRETWGFDDFAGQWNLAGGGKMVLSNRPGTDPESGKKFSDGWAARKSGGIDGVWSITAKNEITIEWFSNPRKWDYFSGEEGKKGFLNGRSGPGAEDSDTPTFAYRSVSKM